MSFQRGTYGELVPLIEQMAADNPDLAGIIVAALALAHVEADHIDDARRLLEQVAAADFDLPLDRTWLSTLADYAEAAIACRDPKCSPDAVRPARALGRSGAVSGPHG